MARVALALSVLSLALVAGAEAKGRVPFDRPSARPGERISIGGGLYASGRVQVWLLPLANAKRWWPSYNGYGPTYGPLPHLAAAVPLGCIGADATRSVRVPNVAAGRYVLAYWSAATSARWTSARADLLPVAGNVLRVRR
jgi:hypothetical protein